MHALRRSAWMCAAGLFLSAHASAEEFAFTARELAERAVTQDVRLTDDGSAVELVRGVLLEDDGPAAGFSYKDSEEEVKAGVRIKKEFLIADPRAASALLLIGSGGSFQAEINGQETVLEPRGIVARDWEGYGLPPSALGAGLNAVVLRGNGKVWIARDDAFAAGSTERTRHANRSARSTNDGRTWDSDRLGRDGTVEGEYCIRLLLDQYRPTGSLLLPVIDAANLEGQVVAPSIKSPGHMRINLVAESTAATEVIQRFRCGSTAFPDSDWIAWQALPDDNTLDTAKGRYFQIQINLKTNDPLQSPQLKGVIVGPVPKRADWSDAVRVVDHHNEQIVRSSIPFEYEPFDHPRLKDLREQYKLDDVVKGANSEFDRILRLAAWSAKRWSAGHLHEAYPPWDACEILRSLAHLSR